MPEQRTVRGTGSGEKRASRRSHRKSRNGCRNCKRRRVKCDETKPACANCVNFSIHCDFTPAPPPIELPQSTTSRGSTPTDSVPSRRRGRPRKCWDLLAGTSAPCDTSSSSSSSRSQPLTAASPVDAPDTVTPHDDLNVADIELLHQYLTATYTGLAGRNPPIETFWRINALHVGFAHHFVLHFPLALSALHLAYLRPDRREHYVTQAEHHFSIGLREVTKLLPRLDADNCQALYISAVLVCFYTWGKGPSPGDFLVFSDEGPAVWMPLLRGVRSIIETAGPEFVFSGLLAPMKAGPDRVTQSTAAQEQRPRIDWEGPVQEFRRFIVASSSSAEANSSELYLRALDSMVPCFEATYGKGAAGTYEGSPVNQVVFRWLYCIEEAFVRCLQRKQPIALLILAYFALLMRILDQHWFMHAWVEHILTGIHGFLDEEYRVWLRWPMVQAGVDPGSGQVDAVMMDSAIVDRT